MKKWIINKLLGYDCEKELKRLNEGLINYRNKFNEKENELSIEKLLFFKEKQERGQEKNKLLNEIKSLRESIEFKEISIKSYEGINSNIEELKKELQVEKNRVIAKMETIEELEKELKNKNCRIKFLEEELDVTNNRLNECVKYFEESKTEVEKLRKINQEMTAKKTSKFTTKQMVDLLTKREGVSRINVEAYNRGNIEVVGTVTVLKVVE